MIIKGAHCYYNDRMEVAAPEKATGDDAAGEVAASADTDKQEASPEDDEPQWVCCMRQVITILGGEVTIAIYQEFIIRNNHTDLQILKNTKVSNQWRDCMYVRNTFCMIFVFKFWYMAYSSISSFQL